MLNRLSKFYLLYFCLLVLGTLKSQYDTTHYIPYLTDLTGNKSLASLERNASVYNGSSLANRPTLDGEGAGGAYIMFSTLESGPFYVRIYKRRNNDWVQTKIIQIRPGSPHTWKLSFGETSHFFRYPQYFEDLGSMKDKNRIKFLEKFNEGKGLKKKPYWLPLPNNRRISENTSTGQDYRYQTIWLQDYKNITSISW